MKHNCITCLCNLRPSILPVAIDWLIYERQNKRAQAEYDARTAMLEEKTR